jgi:AcrR family transcriptional regulator
MGGGSGRDEGDSASGGREVVHALCAATLEVVGRHGIRNTRVHDIVREAGDSRDSFYRHFRGVEHCLIAAYESKAAEVCEATLRGGREGTDWGHGLRQALRVPLNLVAEQPHTAAALIVEGGAAGSPTGPIHNSVLKRLARALESARRQPGSRHTAPPLTADLMVGAINNTLQGLLVKGEHSRAPQLLGGFTYLVMLAFFGEEAAYREMESAEEEA